MHKDLTGLEVGRLKVLSITDDRYHGAVVWLCQCSCGTIKKIPGRFLVKRDVKSCGCLVKDYNDHRTLEQGQAAKNSIFSSYKREAKNKDIEWALSKDQFLKLTQKPCTYCGAPPSNVRQMPRCNGSYVYSGIDRIDNGLGYTHSNSAPCCRDCNIGKHAMSAADWIALCRRVTSYQETSNESCTR